MTADESIWTALGRVEHATRFVSAGAWRTRVLEAGEGEPLLLMHGTGGHLEAYARNVAALAARFHVFAFDFAGHGWTTLARTSLELPDYVEHVRSLMDALQIPWAHMSGESLGGWVAVKFASTYPSRSGRLVLNTPGGTMSTPEVMERIRALSQAAADDPTPDRIRSRLEWLMADPSSVTTELVRVRQLVYSRNGFPGSMKHILCLQDPVVRKRNLISDTELMSIPNGALVIWTSDDPSGPASAGRDMSAKIPGGKFALIENAGHWPQWEQPDEFHSRVLEYLGGDSRASHVR